MKRLSLLILIMGAGAASVGCQTKVDSSSVLSTGVSAKIVVTAQGHGTSQATAVLKVGDVNSNTNLDLQGTDSIVASSGNTAQTMGKTIILGFETYSTSFNGVDVDADETPYIVALRRTLDKGAPNSTCSLPKGFAISAPVPNATFSRANDDIVITWTQPGAPEKMSYSLSGSCIQSDSKDLSTDTGTLTLAKGSIRPFDSSKLETCDLTITIDRTRAGQLDPGYGKGGNIDCRQERILQVRTAP